ncbi:putative signal peptide protein [Oxalobacteraceae bacterium IMCC9480]|nr:putative signal peptide protein [Oxalobacteraceae bacterium IMCC9480]
MMLALLWLAAGLASAQQLDDADARFFLLRTGFAPDASEVARYDGLTRRQAVEQVLAGTRSTARSPAPDWTDEASIPYSQFKDKSDDEKKALRELEQRHAFALRGWWLREMLSTPTPLTERMTLFWHNHFTSSQQKVRATQLMYRQNVLLRQQALGNFGTLLHAIARDPAMLLYLDNSSNRKGAPNENFAREVMELFTLGEGHYSEQDVKEAARALTGWSVERDTGEFRARPGAHDDGSKTVLGISGNLDGDAMLDILLAQPACADYLVDKLWREFISPTPDPREVKRIARQFRDSHYEIKVALRELFLAPAFWDEANRATLIKSPVELVVGTIRQFHFSYDDPLPFTFAVGQLGQNLFNPPNVKGWPGGDAWINSTTLLARKSVLERLFRATDPQAAMVPARMQDGTKLLGQQALGREGRIQFASAATMIGFDPHAWLSQFASDDTTIPDVRQRLAIQRVVLAREPSVPTNAALRGSAYLRSLVMDPVYQLK